MQSYDSRNIYCEGYMPKRAQVNKFDLELSFSNPDERCNNILIDFKQLAQTVIDKDSLAFDLIRISVYVYIADCMTERGGMKDAYDEHWNIDLNFHIPVLDVDFWNNEDVKNLLSKALEFAVGHKYNFYFYKWDGHQRQLFMDLFDTYTQNLDIDCISMFSGGLDSLYSSMLLIEDGRKPLLLSHQSTNKLVKKRSALKEELEKSYNTNLVKWELSIKKKNGSSLEFTQRSRSFVYACLGVSFAKCLKLKDVYLSDNGIVSYNLRCTAQNIGTLNTRSTNPKLIYYINQISKMIWNEEAPQVENKLIHLTKGDVVKGIKELGKEKILSLSHSCVSTLGLTNSEPFCGVCSQCVDRRFAVEYAEISEDAEPRNHYKVDIFKEPLTSQIDRKIGKTHAENYYRKAKIIDKATELEFVNFFNEVWDFIPPDEDGDNFLSNTIVLHENFSKQVFDVITKMSKPFFKGELSDGTLFDIIYSDSKVPISANDYKPIKEKRLVIDLRHKYCTVDKQEFKLTAKELYFINKLAQNKGEFVQYKKLVSKATNHVELAKTRKQQIDNKFKKFCKKANIDYFDLFENKRGYGYKLTLNNGVLSI